MNLRVFITERVTKKPNGDRDTQRHPSSHFKVWLENVEDGPSMMVFDVDQFDSFHCHIDGTRDAKLREAREYAEQLVAILQCDYNSHTVTEKEDYSEDAFKQALEYLGLVSEFTDEKFYDADKIREFVARFK